MAEWKIGDKCFIRIYGAKYGVGRFLVYEAKVIDTQDDKFIVEGEAFQALRSWHELYKTKKEAMGSFYDKNRYVNAERL